MLTRQKKWTWIYNEQQGNKLAGAINWPGTGKPKPEYKIDSGPCGVRTECSMTISSANDLLLIAQTNIVVVTILWWSSWAANSVIPRNYSGELTPLVHCPSRRYWAAGNAARCSPSSAARAIPSTFFQCLAASCSLSDGYDIVSIRSLGQNEISGWMDHILLSRRLYFHRIQTARPDNSGYRQPDKSTSAWIGRFAAGKRPRENVVLFSFNVDSSSAELKIVRQRNEGWMRS